MVFMANRISSCELWNNEILLCDRTRSFFPPCNFPTNTLLSLSDRMSDSVITSIVLLLKWAFNYIWLKGRVNPKNILCVQAWFTSQRAMPVTARLSFVSLRPSRRFNVNFMTSSRSLNSWLDQSALMLFLHRIFICWWVAYWWEKAMTS